MAFQRKGFQKRGGGGSRPALSLTLSVKVGKDYVKVPFTGLWANEDGGPTHKGSLKGDALGQVLELLGNAFEEGLSVSVALFDNSEERGGFKKKPAFKKPGGFKKPNPFKKREEEPEQEEGGEEDGEDPGF